MTVRGFTFSTFTIRNDFEEEEYSGMNAYIGRPGLQMLG